MSNVFENIFDVFSKISHVFFKMWDVFYFNMKPSKKNAYICCVKLSITMNPLEIIKKYYSVDSEAYHILTVHSRSVADKALEIARNHPEMNLDLQFIEEAAMLHDIGIFKCDAEGIDCHGDAPYICHGYLGAELMRVEGYPRHALVCERHTGTGLSLKMIEENNLPVPHRDMRPVSMEEQLICFADKFYSKTKLDKEKKISKICTSLSKYGEETVLQFETWCKLFLGE